MLHTLNSPILATEAAECGLACLVMVARSAGKDVQLHELRKQFPSSLTGLTARNLISVSRAIGFEARALRAEPDHFGGLDLPVILHWDFNHFVVLRRSDRRGNLIDDPARGRLLVSKAETSRRFTGVLVTMEMSESFGLEHVEGDVARPRLWAGIPGMSKAIGRCIGIALIANLAALIVPLQSQYFIDAASTRTANPSVIVVGVIFLLIMTTSVLLDWLRNWFVQVAVMKISAVVVGRVIGHLLHLPMSYFITRHTGDIASRIQSAKTLQDAAPSIIAAAVFDVPMAIMAVIIMASYSTTLMVAAVSISLITCTILAVMSARVRRLSEYVVTAQAHESTNLIETVRAISTVKGMSYQDIREALWREKYANSIARQTDLFSAMINTRSISQVLTGFQMLTILVLGAWVISRGSPMTVGMLVALLAYRQIFSTSVNNIMAQFIQSRVVRMNYDRTLDIIGTAREDRDSAAPSQTVSNLRGDLSMEGVSFRYGRFDPYIVKNLDLAVSSKEMLAIVGSSGQGKSTLMLLAQGLLMPETGEVTWDGRPTQSLPHTGWRKRIGIVAQNDILLAGTIAENISSFDPDVDMDKVVHAAGTAAIHKDIESFPMQYRSLVGDLGSALSAGQKQRLMLARAIYRDPSILFLDEGTANLDPENELIICKVVREWDITRIIVSHRPALVKCADRVLRLADGRLHEMSADQVSRL